MTEMTPRERSELVRRQSRDYIAALRKGRLQRTGTAASAPAQTRDKAPSTFHPSSQASARALEARGKPVPAKAPAGSSPRDEAAAIRRTSAAPLSEMRDARRPRKTARPRMRKADTPMPAADSVSAKIPVPLGVAAAAETPTHQSAVGSDHQPASLRVTPEAEAQDAPAQRRARTRRNPPEIPASPNAAGARDIDVITGLGPALKSKLRLSGIANVEILSVQKPDRLREILGPAGRLVNLEALVRAAKAACGDAAPAAATRASRPATARRNNH